MPNNASAKKRVRQDEKRRVFNRALKSEARTYMKRVTQAVEAKDVATAEAVLVTASSTLDKIAKRNLWHRNNVARKKARLARLVAQAKAAAPSGE